MPSKFDGPKGVTVTEPTPAELKARRKAAAAESRRRRAAAESASEAAASATASRFRPPGRAALIPAGDAAALLKLPAWHLPAIAGPLGLTEHHGGRAFERPQVEQLARRLAAEAEVPVEESDWVDLEKASAPTRNLVGASAETRAGIKARWEALGVRFRRADSRAFQLKPQVCGWDVFRLDLRDPRNGRATAYRRRREEIRLRAKAEAEAEV